MLTDDYDDGIDWDTSPLTTAQRMEDALGRIVRDAPGQVLAVLAIVLVAAAAAVAQLLPV